MLKKFHAKALSKQRDEVLIAHSGFAYLTPLREIVL